MIVRSAPAPARGYLAIVAGAVIPVSSLDAAAREMAAARNRGASFDLQARVTWTRERPLSPRETAELIERAAVLVSASGPGR